MSESSTRRESPLVRFDLPARASTSAAGAGVICAERPFLGHVNLRGDPGNARFVLAASRVIGAALPIAANTVARGGDNVVYWLGPNEWLIVTPSDREVGIVRELREVLAGEFVAVTEISGGQTVIALRGNAVRDLLAKGCPLDLHPDEFAVDHCAQSHLAKAPILVRRMNEKHHFEIVVRRSFADYLWNWLEDAGEEYGLAVEAVVGSPERMTALGTAEP